MPNYQKSEQTKAKIISVTKELLESKGFNGVTVRDICKEADVSLSMLNYHFGSKDGLYFQILQSLPNKIVEALIEWYPDLKNEPKPVSDLAFTLILLDALMVDNEFMKTYRLMYRQPFIQNYIKGSIKKQLSKYHEHAGRVASEQLTEVYSTSFAAAITSVTDEESYALLSKDPERTKMAIQNLFIHFYLIKKNPKAITDRTLAISDSLKIKMSGFDSFELIHP